LGDILDETVRRAPPGGATAAGTGRAGRGDLRRGRVRRDRGHPPGEPLLQVLVGIAVEPGADLGDPPAVAGRPQFDVGEDPAVRVAQGGQATPALDGVVDVVLAGDAVAH